MVLPIAAAIVGGSVAGGALQYLSAREANRAAAAERARIQSLIDNIKDPDFDLTQITPEEYQLVGQYSPELARYIEEVAPQVVQRSGAAQQGQEAMLSALHKLRQVGNTGADNESKALIEQSMRESAGQNESQQASIVDEFARRGTGMGGGLGFAKALSTQQSNGQVASNAGTNAALAAYANRLQALKDSANIGNQIDQADTNLAFKNADIINGYNQRSTANRNMFNLHNTDALNEAQRMNLAAKQNNADRNIDLRNNSRYEQRNFTNRMQQQKFDNSMSKVTAQTGNSNGRINDTFNAARDQNNAISGITSGITSGLMYADSQNREDERMKRYGYK